MAMPEIIRPMFPRRERDKERFTELENQFYDRAQVVQRVWYVIQGNNRDVIDFDLTEGSPIEASLFEFENRKPSKTQQNLVVDRLKAAVDDARELQAVGDASSLLEFGISQAEASYWYARRVRGDKLSPLEYIQNTMDVKPEGVSKEVIGYQREEVLKLFAQNGIEPTEEGFLNWRKEHEIPPQEAQVIMSEAGQDLIRRKNSFTGQKTSVDYEFRPVHEAAYYWAWADSDKRSGRFVIQQNLGTEDRPKIWTPGKAEELGDHEIGQHLLRMTIRKTQIKDARLHPYFGQTTTHGPESVIEEGMGQTVSFFVPGAYDNLSLEGKLQVQATMLRHMAMGNAHIKLNNDPDIEPEDLVAEVKEIIPWESSQEILEQIRERRDNPLLQSYLYAYAEGAKRQLIYSLLLSQDGKKDMIRFLDSAPANSTQLLRHIKESEVDRKKWSANTPSWARDEFDHLVQATFQTPDAN